MATTYTVSNVNVGTYPNDGQGESLRSAFTRVNKNFANVYQLALLGGSNTAGSANISIQANGTYLTNAVSILNFVGAGVTANANGSVITITITGGNAGGGANVIYYSNVYSNTTIVGNVDLGALNSALANLNYVDLTALNNALANVQPTNLSGLGNALANLTYTDLSRLGNALANVQPVNLNALNNALAQVNVNTLANFTNVFNTIAANAANVAKVGIVSGLTANGTANGQAVYNAADGGLYIWQGNAWVKPAAAFTPTAASIATVEIWNTTPKPTTNLINGRTILYTADSNLYIYVGGAWNSYNSYIQGSGTPTVGANTINAAALQAGIITADKIASGAIIAGKIAAGAINASEIAAGTITSGMIATNSIIAGKIAAGVITASEIATGTITATQIAANTITADQIAAQAVTASEIAANAVYAAAIQAYAITADKIAANAITAVSVAANAIYGNSIMAYTLTGDRIRANTITGMSIVGNTIYGNAIMAYTLTGDRIMANSVSGMVLIGNTIFGNAIVGNSITGDQIRANSVSGMVITANTLFANAIVTNSITSAQIKANTITAAQIAASSITADRIDTRGLTIKADDGTVLFGSGKLSSAVTFFDGTSDVSVVSALSQNPIVFIGTYATAPTSGIKENNVYKNTTDGNTYVYKSGTWTSFVTGGTGSTGATGATGPAGAAGASGAPGERGYKEFIYGVAGLSSWNDTYAETAITNVGLTKVLLDRVTLYNSSSPSSFSQSRFWTGSAWSAIAAYINGGLLVNGTIGADAIATNAVTANKILAGAITADKINVGSLSALSANIGVITTGKIQGDVVFSGNIYGANGTFSGSLTANAINAVDTINIKNNAVSGTLSVTLASPLILNGWGVSGGASQPTAASSQTAKLDVLTTSLINIQNPAQITTLFQVNTWVADLWQYALYQGVLSAQGDTSGLTLYPTDVQYYRIRAQYFGNGATTPSLAAYVPGDLTLVCKPLQSISTDSVDFGAFTGLGTGGAVGYSKPVDKIDIQNSAGLVGVTPGWWRFTVDLFALPGPAKRGTWRDPYNTITYDYNNPASALEYATLLYNRSLLGDLRYNGGTNGYGNYQQYPLMYHYFDTGSLTILVTKK